MGCSDLLMPLVTGLLSNCGKPRSSLLATDFYNETWMHRIALQLCTRLRISDSPLSLMEGAWWHSEGRLASPFLPLAKDVPGGGLNNFADGYTRPDAVLGHFELVGPGKIKPRPDAAQFVVGEAKMGSPLSRGVKHDPLNYNQAARTVACIAYVLSLVGRRPADIETLGFYVVAPELQITSGIFAEQTDRAHLLKTVATKVDEYRSGPRLDSSEKRAWFDEWFVPTVDHLWLSVMSWEQFIKLISAREPEIGGQFDDFYHECLTYCPFYSASMSPRSGRLERVC